MDKRLKLLKETWKKLQDDIESPNINLAKAYADGEIVFNPFDKFRKTA